MAYEVLARKWRPQQFDRVVGQDHVVRTLTNAIRLGRVAHAYLFVGPRGVGKTSLARIFAKALNCEAGLSPTPCDRCESCREIREGASLDVHEIDAASNRGIDEIRALRDTIKYMPTRRFKIFIIDEVHMLTAESFNALLKTLEEPPAHIKFLMATTEPQKIPATILSRCQRFDLRRIPTPLLIERLREIARAENVALSEDALLAVARAAEGGLRDAESALDQLIAFQGRAIDEDAVLSVFGLVSREALEALAGALLAGDVPAAIRQVEALDAAGKDMQRLLQELLEQARNLLVYLQAGGEVAALDLTPAQVEGLKAQAGLTHPDRVLRMAEILMDTMDRLPYALSKKTLLETALIRCCRAAAVVSLDELLRQVRALRQELGEPAPAGSAPEPERAPEPAPAARPRPPAPAAPGPSASSAPAEPGDGAADSLAGLVRRWPEVVERVGQAVALAQGCLLDARPLALQGDRVAIGFDPEFPERRDQAASPRIRAALQQALTRLLRRPVTVELALREPPTGAPSNGPAEPPAVADGPQGRIPPTVQQKQKWFQDPAVQKTMDLFNGDIVEIRE